MRQRTFRLAVAAMSLLASGVVMAVAPAAAGATARDTGPAGAGPVSTSRANAAPQLSDPRAKQPAFHLGRGLPAPAGAVQSLLDQTVTLSGIDQDGNATNDSTLHGYLVDTTTGVEAPFTWNGTSLVAQAAPGTYSLLVLVLSGPEAPFNPSDSTFYADHTLAVSGSDINLTVDARLATQVKAIVPTATATEVDHLQAVVENIAGQVLVSHVRGDFDTTLHAFPTGSTTTRDWAYLYTGAYSEPTTVPVPRAYYVGVPNPGQIPSNLTFSISPAAFAQVSTSIHTQGLATTVPVARNELIEFSTVTFFPGVFGISRAALAPATTIDYFMSTGLRWQGSAYLDYGSDDAIYERQLTFRGFTAGGVYNESWDLAAFQPVVEVGHGATEMVVNLDEAQSGIPDRLNLNRFFGTSYTGTMTLRRNGVVVGTSSIPYHGRFTVPATAATFRIDITLTRTTPSSTYVTRLVSSRWQFNSPGGVGDPLDNVRPLLQVRATGAFDLLGRAPMNTTFPLDVRVVRPTGGGAMASITLSVTYNDGVSWTAVTLTPNGTDRWAANVAHPLTSNGFVGLRFVANDGIPGNSLNQTTLRAYGLV